MKLLIALLAISAFALAGCSTTDDAVTPSMDAEGRYVIHLTAANRFSPANAQVPVNSTVVWVNDAGVHDVTAHDDSWSSDDVVGGLGHKMQSGQSYAHNFTVAGDFDYHCTLHSPGMKGTVHVG
jgi:plastocyanin